jgi:hypothetical protein
MNFTDYLSINSQPHYQYVNEAQNGTLSDDELVQLSVINFGTLLPNKVEPKIRKKLEKYGYIEKTGKVTKLGKDFLKDSKTIKRLAKIAN